MTYPAILNELGRGEPVQLKGIGGGCIADARVAIFADGSRVAVEKFRTGTSLEKLMLRALRMTSCGYFTTVLGPGANNAHKSHFHLDYGKHGRTWNYRICE